MAQSLSDTDSGRRGRETGKKYVKPRAHGRMIIPRTPDQADKGSDPRTYHDWQAREMIAESRSRKRGKKRSPKRKTRRSGKR